MNMTRDEADKQTEKDRDTLANELEAMGTICRDLEHLSSEARLRVLGWAMRREENLFHNERMQAEKLMYLQQQAGMAANRGLV